MIVPPPRFAVGQRVVLAPRGSQRFLHAWAGHTVTIFEVGWLGAAPQYGLRLDDGTELRFVDESDIWA